MQCTLWNIMSDPKKIGRKHKQQIYNFVAIPRCSIYHFPALTIFKISNWEPNPQPQGLLGAAAATTLLCPPLTCTFGLLLIIPLPFSLFCPSNLLPPWLSISKFSLWDPIWLHFLAADAHCGTSAVFLIPLWTLHLFLFCRNFQVFPSPHSLVLHVNFTSMVLNTLSQIINRDIKNDWF